MSEHRRSTAAATVLVLAAVIAAAYWMGRSDERAGRPFSLANLAQAADHPTISPVKARPRDAYFPSSEDLLPDLVGGLVRVVVMTAKSPTLQPFIARLTISVSPQIEGRPRDSEVPACSADMADLLRVLDDSLLASDFSLNFGHLDPLRRCVA